MLNKTKLTVFFLLLAALLFALIPRTRTDPGDLPIYPPSLDDYLLELGVPSSVAAEMSETQKQMIYAETVGRDVEFFGYASQDFSLSSDGKLIARETEGTPSQRDLMDSADLTLSVFGLKGYRPTEGVYTYSLYPSFTWHVPIKIANDTFSAAMHSGWDATAEEAKIVIHLFNTYGESVQSTTIPPNSMSTSGNSFRIPSTVGFMQCLYAGYASFSLEKIDPNAVARVMLHYVHDGTSSCSISYGVNLWVGSISLTVTSDDLLEMSARVDLPEFE